jgi:hypothetical protein
MNMKNKYNRGDKVYHITSESPQGVILDIRYYFRSNIYEYFVVWGHLSTENGYYWEEELSETKIY